MARPGCAVVARQNTMTMATSFPPLGPALIGMAVALLAYAGLRDVATRRIPNWVSLLVALLGAALRIGDEQLVPSLAAASAVFGCMVLMWRRGWIGGGDVKLLAATSLLVPPTAVLNLLLAVSLAGGVLSAAYLLMTRLGLPAMRTASRVPLRRVLQAEAWRIRRRGPLPYACAISAGGLITLYGG